GKLFVECLLIALSCMVIACCGVSLAFWRNGRLRSGWRRLCGLGLIVLSAFVLSCAISTIGFGGPLVFWRFRWLLGENDYCYNQPFHRIIVTQKLLTPDNYCNTVIHKI